MTRNMPGEERSGEDLNRVTSDTEGQGPALHDQWYAGGGAVTLGRGPCFPVARHPGLSALVTFYTWPVILALSLSRGLPRVVHAQMKPSLTAVTEPVLVPSAACKK